MNYLSLSLKFFGVALVFWNLGVWGAPGSPAVESGKSDRGPDALGKALRIGVVTDSAPSYVISESGHLDGLDYQVGKVLAEKLGRPGVEFIEGDRNQLSRYLRAGEVDLIMGAQVADRTIPGVIWSRSYLDSGLCLVVHQDSFLRSHKQLRNRKIAIRDDPTVEQWVLENIPGAKVKKFSGSGGWFEAVERREVAALIHDYPRTVGQIDRYPRTRIVQFNLNESHYGVGIAEGNVALKRRVDRALAGIRVSADYDQWMTTYLGYKPSSAVMSLMVEEKPLIGDEPQLAELESPPATAGSAQGETSGATSETVPADGEPALAEAELATAAAEREAPGPGYRSYVVKEGDTLARVATRELGSIYRWHEIWELNRPELANPDELTVGTTLRLPPTSAQANAR